MTWLPRDYLKVELAFGADLSATPDEWSWTDVSVRLRDSGSPQMKMSRGRPDEHGQVQPSNCSFTLGNDDGAFTPGNAASPHYPNVRRGVPVRVSLPDDAPDPKTLVADAFDRTIDGGWGNPDTGIEWQQIALNTPALVPSVDGSAGLLTMDPADNIRTLMAANVGLVDVDVRVTLGLDQVPSGANVQSEIWVRTRYNNLVQFQPDGSVFAGLDRTDGIPSLGSVFTELGEVRLLSPDIRVDTGLTFTGSETFEVRVQAEGATHRFRIWETGSTEPGTWLWEVDDNTYPAGALALGAWASGSQTDALVWSFDDLTVTEPAPPPLFLGRVVEWAPQWPSGDIGDYSRVRLTAGGVLRQQGQRTKQAKSSMAEMIPTRVDDGLRAYWPCEDGANATRLAPGLEGLSPMTISGDVEPSSSAPLQATEPLPRWNDGSASASVPSGDTATVLIDVPSGGLTDGLVFRVELSGGDIDYSEMRYLSTGGGNLEITLADNSGNTDVHDSTSTGLGLDGGLWVISNLLDVLGSTPASVGAVKPVASDGTIGANVNFGAAGIGTASTVGTISGITIGGGLGAAVMGHVAVHVNGAIAFPYDIEGTTTAFNGESAVERFARLCRQADIPAAVTGNPSLSELMGPQQPGLVLDLLRECVEVDSGIMSELSTRLGLGYRARHTLYNQTTALTLDASAAPAGEIQNPFEPILNDLDIVNDVTVSRRGGSSARVLDQDSIDAEGRYDEQVTVNAHTDSQLEGLASWRLHLGTWGGMRYPALSPALNAVASLIPGWVALDLGDKIRVEGLPSQHPAGAVDLLVQGTSDTLTPTGWDGSGNMSPEGPYHVPIVGGDPAYATIGSTSATLAEDLTTTETSVDIDCGAGADWIHEVDFGILIGGERVTVTAAGSAAGTFPNRTQTLTVVRSVDGTVKAHLSGAAIAMADPIYIGL